MVYISRTTCVVNFCAPCLFTMTEGKKWEQWKFELTCRENNGAYYLPNDLYIKDSKCRGGRSTVSTRGGSTIDTVEAITSCVDPEGGIDNCCWDNHCWEDQQSTLTFTWKGNCLMCWSWGGINDHCWDNHCWEDQQSTLTFVWKGNCLMCWSWGGGLMIAVETITV